MQTITPELPMIVTLVSGAKENLKEEEMIMPVFFLSKNDELMIIGAPFQSEEEKLHASQVVKRKAADMKADFVLFIAESLTIKDQIAAKEFMNNRAIYPEGLRGHPKAVDVVIFMLETQTRAWLGMAEILPGREMSAVDWKESPNMGGTFANLMGEKPTVN